MSDILDARSGKEEGMGEKYKPKERKMMKVKKQEVIEVETEGLASLLGQRVLLMCANYFYEGVLEGINDTCCLLSDPGIVYETGKWSDATWADRQQLPGEHYVTLQSIESFCVSPPVVLS
jgi:hypothetical protein